MKELIIVAGANDSGKTTFAKQLIPETGYEFLNADEIERNLNVSDSSSKLKAGRLFFKRLCELMETGQSFILESTLSGKYLLNVIETAQRNGYIFKLFYVYLESPEVCIERIKNRVKLGGHFVPDDDVRRRYYRSKQNFWHTYKDLADKWTMISNTSLDIIQTVAVGAKSEFIIENDESFQQFITGIPSWK